MDKELDHGEQVSADMRQEIDGTRSAMADKLEAFQDRVMNTVQSAQETVEGSIQSANDTMASVKRTFDIRHQVRQHPWAMVGGSILAGVALGSLFEGLRRRAGPIAERTVGHGTAWRPTPTKMKAGCGSRGAHHLPSVRAATAVQTPPCRSGFKPRRHPIGRESSTDSRTKSTPFRGWPSVTSSAWCADSIREAMPQVADQIEDVMNRVTTKLGGEPFPPHSL